MTVRRIWIDDGCISCNLCEDLCPEVFEVPAGGTCQVKKGYEVHLSDPSQAEPIQEAVDSCPVEVIKLDEA